MKRRFLLVAILLSVTLLPLSPNNSTLQANGNAPGACRWKWAQIEAPSHPGPAFAHRVAVRNADDVWVAGTNLWHWDGSRWNVALKGKNGAFIDVVTLGKRRVYALGSNVVFWNGKKWKQVGILPPSHGRKSSLAVVSKNDIWVSEIHPNGTTQMVHWNGSRWTQVGERITGSINDMEVVAPNDIWVGGETLSHWDGVEWKTILSIQENYHGEIYRIQSSDARVLWAVGSRSFYNGHTSEYYSLALYSDGDDWAELEGGSGGRLFSGVLPVDTNDVWFTSDTGLSHWDGTAFTAVLAGPDSRAGLNFGDITSDEYGRLWIVGNYFGDSAWAQRGNGGAWQDFDLPGWRQKSDTQFLSITAPSDDDVWIAGSYSGLIAGSDYQEYAMLTHWNGIGWSFVDLGHEPGHLNDISASSPNDIWAIGTKYSLDDSHLLFHYDGINWQRVPDPTLPDVNLEAVATLSQSDAWAVGSIYRKDAPTPYWEVQILHWDGSGWTVSPTPPIGGPQSMLHDVVALAPNDVWAVGDRLDEGYDGTSSLVMHWDGSTWKRVPSPNPKDYNWLSEVTSLAPGEIWATGATSTPSEGSRLLIHWNGHDWETFMDNSNTMVKAISPLAPKSLWGIELVSGGGTGGVNYSVTRWNGKRWRTFWDGGESESLWGTAVLSSKEVWAVGHSGAGPSPSPLIVRGVCQVKP